MMVLKAHIILCIIHVFKHAREACCGHSSNVVARKVGEGCNIEFGV
jgi:hypothetical protein